MQAIIFNEPGSPEVLVSESRPLPDPGRGEVRIRILAAGVNRPDIIQRQGKYPAPPGVPADIPGLEVAGIIDHTGEGVTRWQAGDAVCALVAGGGYAEYVIAPEAQCLPIPEGLSMAEAATLPETFFTVWSNVFDRGNFSPGESVLIHGGTSGIGVAGIQMIKGMGGKVIVTAGTEEKCQLCLELGADHAINYRKEDFAQIIRDTGGVDIILDMIGGDYTPKNISCLNTEGRLIIINAMNGRMGEVDLMRVMVKRLTITGSTLRAREVEFKGEIARQLEKNIWPMLENKTIRPVVFATFSLRDAAYAHHLMESGEHMGKIVLLAE